MDKNGALLKVSLLLLCLSQNCVVARRSDLTARGDQENCPAALHNSLFYTWSFLGYFANHCLCLSLSDINIKESSKARAPAYTFGNR